MQARSIGFYTRGCLAGGVALPINGKTWQVMRLSRNAQLGPSRIWSRFMERLAEKVPKVSNWPGLLVGDMAQARGGPMLTGHASHQVGLDADIWLTPMPKTPLSREEREEMSATDVVAADKKDVDPKIWTPRPLRGDQGGGRGPEGRAHLRQRGDQEGAVPRGRQGPRLAAQGAPVVGAQLSFPRAHRLPGRQPGMQGAGPGDRGAKAAARISTTGSSESILNPPPPKEPPKPRPRSRWRTCRRPAGRCWWRREHARLSEFSPAAMVRRASSKRSQATLVARPRTACRRV